MKRRLALLSFSVLLPSCLKQPYIGITNHPNLDWSCRDWPITLKCWCGDVPNSMMSEKKNGGSFSYDEASKIWGTMKVYGMECFVDYNDGPRGDLSVITFIVTVNYLLQGGNFTYDDYVDKRGILFFGSPLWSGSDFSYTIEKPEDLSFVKNYFSIDDPLDESDAPKIGDVWHFTSEAKV